MGNSDRKIKISLFCISKQSISGIEKKNYAAMSVFLSLLFSKYVNASHLYGSAHIYSLSQTLMLARRVTAHQSQMDAETLPDSCL
jgi:hypothetical protein